MDNAKAFQKASKWIKKVYKDERPQKFVVTEQLKWKFNLTSATWWGGQFERMVGLVKRCLYKATAEAKLMKKDIEEVISDTEVNLNN